MLSFRYLALLLLAASVLLWNSNEITAQEVPVEKKSVIVFDIDAAKIVETSQLFGVGNAEFDEIPMEGIFEGVSIREVASVKGSLSLPGQVEDLMTLGLGGEFPLEFYVQFEFTNADACLMLTENVEAGSEEITIGDKTFWTPEKGSAGPEDVLGHRRSDTVFEFGTKPYLTSKGREFLTDELVAVWKTLPADSTIRVAVDLETPGKFVAGAIDMSRESAGVQEEAYLDLVEKMKSLSIAANLNADKMLSLAITGKTADDAEEIQSGLDSLVGLAQMGVKLGLGQVAKEMPEEAAVMKNLIDSIEPKQNKETVRIDVMKPEGFDDALKKFLKYGEKEAKKMTKQNNFRQVGLAILNFEAAQAKFPFDREDDELGWRVHVLQYIDQNKTYKKFDMAEGHANEQNAKMADEMPNLFGTDGKRSTIAWIKSEVTGFADITDGSSNTVMLIEYPAGEPWLQNGGLSVDKAVELVSGLKDGEELVITMYDCSTRKITNAVDKETLKNLFTPTDGNVVNMDF